MSLKKEIAERLKITRIIWVALLGAIFIYLFLGYMLPRMGDFNPPASPPPVVIAHALMVIGIIGAIAGVLIATGKLPLLKVEQNESVSSVLGKVLTFMIMSWALCESAALMGLVIFFLFGSFQDLLVMSSVAVIGMIFSFPTEGKFMEAARKTGNLENL